MTANDIDIILKSDDFILVQITLNDEIKFKKEYPKETQLKKIYEDYLLEVRDGFPAEIKDILKSQRDKDVTNDEELLLNYVNGYEEENSTLSKFTNLNIPDIIGKPFDNPFTVFTYVKKDKTLKCLKFEGNDKLEELNDYGPFSAYCNGNNKLFISGGQKNQGEYVEKFWIIDLNSAEIESNSMIAKKNHSMILIPGNYVFIVGGQTKGTFYYDLENNKFHGWKKLNKQRIEPALILVNEYLYCFDNMNSQSNENFSFERTKLLDSIEHNWEKIEPIMPLTKMTQKYFGVARNNDDIIFIGGSLDLEEEKDKITERKNFKYNITGNKIEESDINYINYNFKEKSFLKYNEKISYILPDFNRFHPEVMFYQKEKNAIKFLKCYSKKKLEEKEREKEEKNVRDNSPFKRGFKLNLNQPIIANIVEGIIKSELNKTDDIKNINENLENENEEKKDDNLQNENLEMKEEEKKDEFDQNNNQFEQNYNQDNQNNNQFEQNYNQDNQNNNQYEKNDIQNDQNNNQFEQNYNQNDQNNNQFEQNYNQDNQNNNQFEQNDIQNDQNNNQFEQNDIQNDQNNNGHTKQNFLQYKYDENNNNNNDYDFNNNNNNENNLNQNSNKDENPETNMLEGQYGEQEQKEQSEKKSIKENENQYKEEGYYELNDELNNDVNTNDLAILDDILKASQPKPQENIEIKVEGDQTEEKDINLKGENKNISFNPEMNDQNMNNEPQTNEINQQANIENKQETNEIKPNDNINQNQNEDNINNMNKQDEQGQNINNQQQQNVGGTVPPQDENVQLDLYIGGIIIGINDDPEKYAKVQFNNFEKYPADDKNNNNINEQNNNQQQINNENNINQPNNNIQPNNENNLNQPNNNIQPNNENNLNQPNDNIQPNNENNLNQPNDNIQPNNENNLNQPNTNEIPQNNNPNTQVPNAEGNNELDAKGEYCIVNMILGETESDHKIIEYYNKHYFKQNLNQMQNQQPANNQQPNNQNQPYSEGNNMNEYNTGNNPNEPGTNNNMNNAEMNQQNQQNQVYGNEMNYNNNYNNNQNNNNQQQQNQTPYNVNPGNNYNGSDNINIPLIDITDPNLGGNFKGNLNANIQNDNNTNGQLQFVKLETDRNVNETNMNQGYNAQGNYGTNGMISSRNENNASIDIEKINKNNLLLLNNNNFNTNENNMNNNN